jgi:hypothetical protein
LPGRCRASSARRPKIHRPAPDPIAALDSAPPQRLVAAALEGGDETLRAAAIGKLLDGESLRTLAGLSAGTASGVPASLERAAQERLAQLVDAGTSSSRRCVRRP